MTGTPFDSRLKPWWQRKSYQARTVNLDDPTLRDMAAMARMFGLRLKVTPIPFGSKGAWFKNHDGHWHRTHVDEQGNPMTQIGPTWR